MLTVSPRQALYHLISLAHRDTSSFTNAAHESMTVCTQSDSHESNDSLSDSDTEATSGDAITGADLTGNDLHFSETALERIKQIYIIYFQFLSVKKINSLRDPAKKIQTLDFQLLKIQTQRSSQGGYKHQMFIRSGFLFRSSPNCTHS